MTKRPASLTSELLARKGEAEPSSIDPSARMTLAAGPGYSTTGGSGGYNETDADEPLELRPQPPEPEVIYTAEDDEENSKPLRLILGLVIAIVVVGGIVLTVTSKTEKGVAPVSPQLTAQAPVSAPAAKTEELRSDMETTAPAEENTSPYAAYVDKPAEETVPEDSAFDSPAPETPAPKAPVAATAEPAKPVAASPAANQSSGGSYVVQLAALRDETSALKAYAALSKKHALLKDHAPDIEKADLGAKGFYYRVRASGFDSKSDAANACAKLKSAGQDCMVKKR